jgi:hypothetical protein
MFTTPTLSMLMCWHHTNKNTHELASSAVDSKAWAHINLLWPHFIRNLYNVRLGLTLDGVNPYGNQSTN